MLALVASLSGVVMALSPIFQILQFKKRKTSDDVSMKGPFTVLIGATIWVLYGISISADPVIIMNSICGGMQIVMLVMIRAYRTRSKPSHINDSVIIAQDHLVHREGRWEDHRLCQDGAAELLGALYYLGYELAPRDQAKSRATQTQGKTKLSEIWKRNALL